jgi:hypothetical protein
LIDNAFLDAARTSGSSVEQAGAAFMLHPETFAESAAAGYTNPFAGYVVGRGGVLAATSGAGLPLFAGWATMPLAEDTPARAMQVIFVLRELRGSVHFNALTISGVTPVEAHVLNKGAQYAKTFGWSEPFPDGADKKQLLADVEQTTNRRISEILSAALTAAEVNAALSAQ